LLRAERSHATSGDRRSLCVTPGHRSPRRARAGNSFESTLVAVVVPKEDALKEWAKSRSLPADDFAALCKAPEAKQFILQALVEQAKLSKLRGFEFIKNVHLDAEEFSVDNGCVTPTFKLRRPQLKERYNSVIDAMYKALK
jgi:long-chain acyl-CoA synthetase